MAAQSKTDLCNMALAHLGQQKPIDDFDNDRGVPARACRLFYDDCLKATFRDFSWPFATKIAALTLYSKNGDANHPDCEWAYAYQQPTESIMFRRILSGLRNDTRQSRVPYKFLELQAVDASPAGTLVLTDYSKAKAEYTILREDVERFPSDFNLAFSRRLACYIAPMVTGGDPFKLQDKNLSLYAMEISIARGSAGNEEQMEEMVDAEQLNARNM